MEKKSKKERAIAFARSFWEHLNQDVRGSRVDWRHRAAILNAIMLFAMFKWVMPTDYAQDQGLFLAVLISLLLVASALFVRKARTYRPHGRSLWEQIVGELDLPNCPRYDWVRAWRMLVVFNLAIALIWVSASIVVPAASESWQTSRKVVAERKATEQAREQLCTSYTGDELTPYERRICLDWREDQAEKAKSGMMGWYRHNTARIHHYGIWIGGVLFLTVVVIWTSSRIRRPYYKEIDKLDGLFRYRRAEQKRAEEARDEARRRVQELEGEFRRVGEAMITWEVILRHTTGGHKREIVPAVARVRRDMTHMMPQLIEEEDRRDALRERARRALEEVEAVSAQGGPPDHPAGPSPS